MDRLVHALDWRTLLLHGPGGADDLAALEVGLDAVRLLSAIKGMRQAMKRRFIRYGILVAEKR